MRTNPYGRILGGEPKDQHLRTIPKSCPNDNRVTTPDRIN